MICEKCGKKIDHLLVSIFNYDGSDSEHKVPIEEDDGEAVVMETSQNWTGYELSEEEQMDRLRCPHCHQFPFKHREVQVYDVVRVVCFKTLDDGDGR